MSILSKLTRALNPFPAGLREEILDRDRYCFMKRLDPTHRCRDRLGNYHRANDRRLLTMEHVKPQLAMGILKKHVPWLIVALCGYENNRPPSKQTRFAMRTYLARLYPEKWAEYFHGEIPGIEKKENL